MRSQLHLLSQWRIDSQPWPQKISFPSSAFQLFSARCNHGEDENEDEDEDGESLTTSDLWDQAADDDDDDDDAVDDEPGVEWWFGWAGKPAEENWFEQDWRLQALSLPRW